MSPLQRRMLLHGAITAVLLFFLGLVFVQIAVMWMSVPDPSTRPGMSAGAGPTEGTAPVQQEDLGSQMQWQVPIRMAIFGFLFAAFGEWVTDWLRRRKSAQPGTAPPSDDKMVEELLKVAKAKEAEEKAAKPTGESPAPPASPPPATP